MRVLRPGARSAYGRHHGGRRSAGRRPQAIADFHKQGVRPHSGLDDNPLRHHFQAGGGLTTGEELVQLCEEPGWRASHMRAPRSGTFARWLRVLCQPQQLPTVCSSPRNLTGDDRARRARWRRGINLCSSFSSVLL